VGSDEWMNKKAKKMKMEEFGQQIKSYNKQNVVVDPLLNKIKEEVENQKE